jgi:hypothetical protein
MSFHYVEPLVDRAERSHIPLYLRSFNFEIT